MHTLKSEPIVEGSIPKVRLPPMRLEGHTPGNVVVSIVVTDDFEPTPIIICH